MSRRLPADGVPRTGMTSSEGRVESPRANSSLGPDAASVWKASVPGTGLLYWPAGGGVRAPRGRATIPPGGGGAKRAPVAGRAANGFEDGRGVKGSDAGDEANGDALDWEPVARPGCKGEKGPPSAAGAGGATRGGPKPGAAAEGTGGVEPAAGDWGAGPTGGMGAAGPRPAGDAGGDGARGGPAAGRMTVTAPMT